MLRRMFVFAISGVVALSLLAGCSKEEIDLQATDAAHKDHEVTSAWDRNGKEHWHPCECGEKIAAQSHTLDENGICTVCGSEVLVFNDHSAYVYNYNEQGDVVRYTTFDTEGMLKNEQTFEYEYDADGNMTLSKQYANDVLAEEITYTVNKRGDVVPVKQTGYDANGAWTVNEYDENGNVIKILTYDVQDTVTYECDIVLLQTENGDTYEAVKTEIAADGSKTVAEYNECGDSLGWKTFDAEGNLTYEHRTEYVYTEGTLVSSKFYVNGVLDSECEYALDSDNIRYISKETVYAEDKSYTVSEYDAEGELLKETAYNKDGKEISATKATKSTKA